MLRVVESILFLLRLFVAIGAAAFYVLYLFPGAAACPRHS